MKVSFKDATKIQNGRHGSTQQKKSEIIQILLSHPPRYGDVQVTFSKFYWNSKWPIFTHLKLWFAVARHNFK